MTSMGTFSDLMESITYRVVGSRTASHWERPMRLLGDLAAARDDGQRVVLLRDLESALRTGLFMDSAELLARGPRSPWEDTRVSLPTGRFIGYAYERMLEPRDIESRFRGTINLRGDWNADTVLYSSGMAALQAVLSGITWMLDPTAERPLSIALATSYFETSIAARYLTHPGAKFTVVDSVHEALDADIMVFEPVRYTWQPQPLSMYALRSMIRDARRIPQFVIVDSTMLGQTWPRGEFLEALTGTGATIVDVRSTSKLEQFGLEIAMCGVVDILVDGGVHHGHTSRDIAALLRQVRAVNGTGLGIFEVAALDAEAFTDRDLLTRYARSVLERNAELAMALDVVNSTFLTPRHPVLVPHHPSDVADLPFVILQNEDLELEDYGYVIGWLQSQAATRRLPFHRGSSCGFQHSRFEVIVPAGGGPDKALIKVARGARPDPSDEGVQDLLRELLAFDSIDALRGSAPLLVPFDIAGGLS